MAQRKNETDDQFIRRVDRGLARRGKRPTYLEIQQALDIKFGRMARFGTADHSHGDPGSEG